MSIKDDLLKYFSQFTDTSGGYGINPQAPTGGQFGQLNAQMQPIGSGGFNQLNTMTNAMSNPIDAQKAMGAIANPAAKDMGKQLIAKAMGGMGSMGARPQQQAPLQMIQAQRPFAQDATQPQQIQEFQPQQMAMMLRKKHGY